MSENNKYLIILTGPTAVGKTELSIELAQWLDTDIISCDARQFYKEMNIGTAKPNKEEMGMVRHHFINNLSITENYSAGDFERDAILLLEEKFKTSNSAFVTGGSGLYIKAVCEGFDQFPEVPEDIINSLKSVFALGGINPLQEELKIKDPQYYKEIDLNNPHRIIRALSVIRTSNQPFSLFQSKNQRVRTFTPIYIILHRDREELYDRINKRVDLMIEDGLIDEVKSLLKFKDQNALQTVGYQELFDYFDGIHDLGTAIELIKRNSRRYAKRQLTWFRKIQDSKWFHPEEVESIKAYIELRLG